MTEDGILFIVNSIYQLLTVIHMRKNLLQEEKADLILTDLLPQPEKYLDKLKKTHLFQRVLFARTKELTGRYIVGDIGKISRAYENHSGILRWVLNENPGSYRQVYFSNYDTFVRMLACEYYGRDCAFYCFEDGFSTYIIDYLREDRAAVNRSREGNKIKEMVRGVWLYEPQLSMGNDSLPNIRIPKISVQDTELKQILNDVFDYRGVKKHPSFLFLEQSFRAENIACNDLELMKLCQQIVGPGNFAVKPHPRNPRNLPYERGLTGKYRNEAPWELFLLNEYPQNQTILTVCSNGALTGRIVLGMDIPTVMLYRLFQGRVLWKEDEILQKYLHKFRVQFAGKNYFVPETVYELKSILNYLKPGGSEHV